MFNFMTLGLYALFEETAILMYGESRTLNEFLRLAEDGTHS